MHSMCLVDLIYFRPLRVALTGAAFAAFTSVACTSASTTATAPSSAKCQVVAAATPVQFGAAGGSGSLKINAPRDCGWSVAAQASWVSVSGTPSGYGDAALSYTVTSNPLPAARTAELVVDEQRLQLTQAAAACTYSLSRSDDSIGPTGGTVGFDVSTLPGCAWSATTSVDWLTVASRASGSASASVRIDVAPNTTGAARIGVVTVAGRSYTLVQDGALGEPGPGPAPSPAPSPAPTPAPVPSPTPEPPPSPVSLTGTVSAITGSCPTLRFSAGGRTIVTDQDTTYTRAKCNDLSNGDSIAIAGTIQTDGTVLADKLEFNKNGR